MALTTIIKEPLSELVSNPGLGVNILGSNSLTFTTVHVGVTSSNTNEEITIFAHHLDRPSNAVSLRVTRGTDSTEIPFDKVNFRSQQLLISALPFRGGSTAFVFECASDNSGSVKIYGFSVLTTTIGGGP